MITDIKVKLSATALRLVLGWYMLADGLDNLFTPGWHSSGFLLGAKTFPAFYAWFALPSNAWWCDPLNLWSIVLIGVALILGVAVRPAAWAGAALMILYYFPHYVLPYVPHGFIVEEHIINAAGFVFVAVFPPAQEFGLGTFLRGTFLGRIPVVGKMI
jgi:thiosulfate dehydrogenase [quinone] large subunit